MTESKGPGRTEVLRIERTFNATRERVFEAWTDPSLMRIWSAPAELRVDSGEGDVRPGGRWRVEMVERHSGQRHIAVGRYIDVVPPTRLSMTHSWLNAGETIADADARATTVTIELHEQGPRTRMVFTQTGFESAASRDGHGEGWKSAFDQLAAILETPIDAPGLPND